MSNDYNRGYEIGYAAGWAAASTQRKWSARDTKTLIGWEGSTADLAVKLNRSALAIRMKRHKLRAAGLMPPVSRNGG